MQGGRKKKAFLEPTTLMQGNSGSLTQVRGRGDRYTPESIRQYLASSQLLRREGLLKPPVVLQNGNKPEPPACSQGARSSFFSSPSHDKDHCRKVIAEHRQERQESFLDYSATAAKKGDAWVPTALTLSDRNVA